MRQRPIKFFLPESDDLVDPGYDFSSDTPSPNRVPGKDDVYAHELMDEPCFDGLLITKSNISKEQECEVIAAGGVHQYYRLPTKYPIMGDCGAFQFISQPEPPYTCAEILDYYENLNFDFGMTLDHVILDYDTAYDAERTIFPKMPSEDMQRRYEITLRNAAKMRELAKKKRSKVKLIGVVQGWSPASYHAAIKRLIKVGFDYISIGGVAKAPNEVIVPILHEIRETVIKHDVKLHVLGVARVNILAEYIKCNVASCDSTGPLMQGLKGGKYFSETHEYCAIRIPQVYGNTSPKVRRFLGPLTEQLEAEKKRLGGKDSRETKRLTKDIDAKMKELAVLESEALRAVSLFGERKLSLNKALEKIIAYEDKFEGESKFYADYKKTLEDRPWEVCRCQICKEIGPHVAIMRSNNRNRRRGFHNTYVFYRQFLNFFRSPPPKRERGDLQALPLR